MPERFQRCKSGDPRNPEPYGIHDCEMGMVAQFQHESWMEGALLALRSGTDRLNYHWVSEERFEFVADIGKHAFLVSE